MGPEYRKFVEAVLLVGAGYAFPVNNRDEFVAVFKTLTADPAQSAQRSAGLKVFMQKQAGATATIMAHIADRKWLQ
jgi:3-deoxy-D-manno-octulosonic-acid transferase